MRTNKQRCTHTYICVYPRVTYFGQGVRASIEILVCRSVIIPIAAQHFFGDVGKIQPDHTEAGVQFGDHGVRRDGRCYCRNNARLEQVQVRLNREAD